MPGGGVEPGEEAEQCAIRELQEEVWQKFKWTSKIYFVSAGWSSRNHNRITWSI